jgi:hypothetical protein
MGKHGSALADLRESRGGMLISVHAESRQDLPPGLTRVATQLRDSALQDEFAYEFLRELTTRFRDWGTDIMR